MKIDIPFLHQDIKDESLVESESTITFTIDTSIYSEERWEMNFPLLAQKESLYSYIQRVIDNAHSERVRVACMLKALFCFIESDEVKTYKEFAQMFSLSNADYTDRLIKKLVGTFKLITGSSAVKN